MASKGTRKGHDESPKHPPVKDVDGRRYTENGKGGWIPDDDPNATPMSWRALTQEVPDDGNLVVDHEGGEGGDG